MKISTGLKLEKKLVHTQRVSVFDEFFPGSFPIPQSWITPVWVVECITLQDTKEYPRGTVKHAMIFQDEPAITHRVVRLILAIIS